MGPAEVGVVDPLALTPTGKVDRTALPAPVIGGGEQSTPHTLVESLIADLFADVLGAAQVGADDSFFDLGGNSLQAMQLLSRLRDTFDIEADVTDIFQAPTTTTLAELLDVKHGVNDENLADDGWLTELAHLSNEEADALLESLEEAERRDGSHG